MMTISNKTHDLGDWNEVVGIVSYKANLDISNQKVFFICAGLNCFEFVAFLKKWEKDQDEKVIQVSLEPGKVGTLRVQVLQHPRGCCFQTINILDVANDTLNIDGNGDIISCVPVSPLPYKSAPGSNVVPVVVQETERESLKTKVKKLVERLIVTFGNNETTLRSLMAAAK